MSLGDFWNVFDPFFMVPLAYHANNGFLKDVFSGLLTFASSEGNFFMSDRDIRVPFFARRSMQDFGILLEDSGRPLLCACTGFPSASAADLRYLGRGIRVFDALEFRGPAHFSVHGSSNSFLGMSLAKSLFLPSPRSQFCGPKRCLCLTI